MSDEQDKAIAMIGLGSDKKANHALIIRKLKNLAVENLRESCADRKNHLTLRLTDPASVTKRDLYPRELTRACVCVIMIM